MGLNHGANRIEEFEEGSLEAAFELEPLVLECVSETSLNSSRIGFPF